MSLPLPKFVARADTTVVDAYLNPVLRDYVANLRPRCRAARCGFSHQRADWYRRRLFRGKDSILSGPAGGVVGFSRVAQAAGFSRAIGFDMGGTSTDVSRFDGRFDLEYETEKAGVRLVAPMMAIETVAAGGGSICRFDGVKLDGGAGERGRGAGAGLLRARWAADGYGREFVFGTNCGGAVSVSIGSGGRLSGGSEELAAEAASSSGE